MVADVQRMQDEVKRHFSQQRADNARLQQQITTLKGEKTEAGGATGQHAATSNKLVHGLLQVDEFLHVKESKGNVLGTSSGSVAGGLVLGKFAFQFGYAFLEVCLALALWG